MEITWLLLASLFIIMGSCFSLAVNIYRLVYIDAKSRGIEKPKFWAFMSMSGQGGEGLFFYLFKRKNYEKNISSEDADKMDKIKKRIKYIIFLQIMGVVIFVLNFVLMQ